MPGFLGAVSAPGGTATAAFPRLRAADRGQDRHCQQPPQPRTLLVRGLVNPEPTAPNQPQYVVVVTVEQAGFGGTIAAPIARRIIEALSGNLNRLPCRSPSPRRTDTEPSCSSPRCCTICALRARSLIEVLTFRRSGFYS